MAEVQVLFEVVNTIVLATALNMMYRGIEIGHPIYAILFCDLLIAFVSSFVNAFVFPFVSFLPYFVLVNGNSVACLLLHCCCWCVLSFLRYVFIVKKSWLDSSKLFEMKNLLSLSLLVVALLFTASFSSMLGITMYFGYPEKKLLSFPVHQRVICLMVYIGNYVTLMLVSCTFYYLILVKSNKVDVEASVISSLALPQGELLDRNEEGGTSGTSRGQVDAPPSAHNEAPNDNGLSRE